ncbi:hypothetical protein HLVA_03340 [Haliovirga abyssi]|uniref:50S ribosomal protein L28 n=1 Tax=Haliovirga abyssi TaxID=2996794 RepID=A0AAU9D914_9FUSO|nr:hypothetical protein HLVA_03340 [Haliovirga abyssi]
MYQVRVTTGFLTSGGKALYVRNRFRANEFPKNLCSIKIRIKTNEVKSVII